MMIRCRGALCAGTLALALAACAQEPQLIQRPLMAAPAAGEPRAAKASPVAAEPVLHRTALARYVEIIGPKTPHAPPFLGVPQTNFFLLRSWLDRKTGKAKTQLYVADSYSGREKVWDAARDGAGSRLPFVPILRKEITCENGCAWEEEFAATIPQSALETSRQDHQDQGLAVTFTARSGDTKTIRLSAGRVRGQLAALDAARARLLPRTAATSPEP